MHINARTLDAIADRLEQAQDCRTEQSLEALAFTYLNYASQNFNRWRNIFESPLPSDAETPDWYQEKVDHVFAFVEAQFIALAPEQLSDNHKKRAARALWCGVHGICALSLTDKQDKADINDIEETIILLVRNFMRGWVAYSNTPPPIREGCHF